MPRYFIDSSALAKRYRTELGTAILDQIFNDEQSERIICRLTWTELYSVFAMRVRVGEINLQDLMIVQHLMQADERSNQVRTLPVRNEHYEIAERLLFTTGLVRGLRTLDALQIAVAQQVAALTPIDFIVAADKKLLGIGASLGFATLDPENP